MPRFYCSQALALGNIVTLPEHVAHHIQVLRLKSGERITLFNGEGGEYTATISSIEKKRVAVEIKLRSEEHTSELQSLMRISYAVFFLKKKNKSMYTEPGH